MFRVRWQRTWVLPLSCAGLLALSGCAGTDLLSSLDTSARLTKTLTAETNRELDPGENETLLTAALDAGLVLTAETQRSFLRGELGLASAYFVGSDPLGGTGRIDPRLSAEARFIGKRTVFRIGSSFELSSSDTTQVDDSGVTDVNATQVTADFNAGADIDLDTRNRLSLDLTARLIDFDEDVGGLTPTRTVGLSAELRRRLNTRNTLSLSAGLRHFTADDDEGTRSQTLDFSGTLDHQGTPRHRVRLSLGASAVRTVEEIAGGSPVLDIGFSGGFHFSYRLANLTFDLDTSQGIEPSSVGELQSFTRGGIRMAYRINSRESLASTLTYTRRAPISGDTGTLHDLSFGPSYLLAIDPDTQLSLGYLFRLRNDTDGTATGHRVFLSLERQFPKL